MTRNFNFSQAANNGVTVLPDTTVLPRASQVLAVQQATAGVVTTGFVDVSSILGTMSYLGGWNAATNTPALASGALAGGLVQPSGGYYLVLVGATTAAIDGITIWVAGDYAVSNGHVWQRSQNSSSAFLPLSGGTLTGPVTLSGNATLPLHAVPLQQVNTAAAGGPFLPMSGGAGSSMSGHIYMANHAMLDVSGINSYGYAPLPFSNPIQTTGYQFYPPAGTITWSGAAAPSFLDLSMNLAGTTTATHPLNANQFIFSSDIIDASSTNYLGWFTVNGNIGMPPWRPSTAYTAGAYCANSGHAYSLVTPGTSAASGGPTGTGSSIIDGTAVWAFYQVNSRGDRAAISGQITVASQTGDLISGRANGMAAVGVGGSATITANQGGTNLTTNAAGGCYGMNALASIGTGATNIGSLIGLEIDIAALVGSSVKNKVGLQVVQTSVDAVSATNGNDIGYFLGNQAAQGSASGWMVGLAFGDTANGFFPLRSTGTLIKAATQGGTINAASGIDLSAVTFSSYSLHMPGFTVDGSGHTSPLLANAANDAAAATAGVPIGAMYRNGNAVQVRLT